MAEWFPAGDKLLGTIGGRFTLQIVNGGRDVTVKAPTNAYGGPPTGFDSGGITHYPSAGFYYFRQDGSQQTLGEFPAGNIESLQEGPASFRPLDLSSVR